MEYKLIMPRLTDTMEVGKIVRWLKKEGDLVEENEPVVEVESDKAVMDIPSFKSGVIEKIIHQEGEEVPVGETIAIIETDMSKAGEKKEERPEEEVAHLPKEEKETSIVEELLPISVEEEKKEEEIKVEIPEEEKIELPEGTASPSAKKLAKELGIDLKKEQEKGNLPTPAHEKDIKEFYYSKFFSKKALELAKEHEIDLKELVDKYGKKITEKEVKKYILENNIPTKKEISSIQKSLIASLSKSVEIPVFHIYEDMDTSNIPHDETATLTVWILKIIGDTMQLHDRLRAKMEGDNYLIYPNSNISVAIAVNEDLYAPVVKNVNQKNLLELKEDLATLKQKTQENKLTPEDLSGATFAISNLGMFNIKSFDAIIPPGLVGIVATGREINGITNMTFSFDHRIINGREAALFVVSLKEKFQDKKYLKELKKEISK